MLKGSSVTKLFNQWQEQGARVPCIFEIKGRKYISVYNTVKGDISAYVPDLFHEEVLNLYHKNFFLFSNSGHGGSTPANFSFKVAMLNRKIFINRLDLRDNNASIKLNRKESKSVHLSPFKLSVKEVQMHSQPFEMIKMGLEVA